MKTLVMIPAYNEQENIIRVIEDLRKTCPDLDYVVINDGSKDQTAALCRQGGYNLIDLPINLGLAGAFQAGMKYAFCKEYDYAIQYDADGQHRADYIRQIMEEAEKGWDIVIGSRFVNQKKPKSMRMLGSNVISLVVRMMTGRKINDPTSGMRMYNKKMIREFALSINYGPEPDTISYLVKRGAEVSEIQVEMDERIAGESYLNVVRSILYMIRMVISIVFIQNFRKRDKHYQ